MSRVSKFIDIGANLTDLMYSGIYNGSTKHKNDLQHVLSRSWASGIDKIIITGGNLSESKSAIELADQDDRLFTTVGCHPTRCAEFESYEKGPEAYFDDLLLLLKNNSKKVIAIGECGLDYDRTQFCSVETQKKYFKMQLKLVEYTKLPIFLHCRNAANDLYEILKDFNGITGVVHSFDGTIDEATKFIDLGYLIGINGCSLKTDDNLRTVSKLSIDKILLETDCPWCEIRPSHAGYAMISKENFMESTKKEKWKENCLVKSRNEPANIRQVLDVLAAIKQVDKYDIANRIYENTMELFFNK